VSSSTGVTAPPRRIAASPHRRIAASPHRRIGGDLTGSSGRTRHEDERKASASTFGLLTQLRQVKHGWLFRSICLCLPQAYLPRQFSSQHCSIEKVGYRSAQWTYLGV
jgi:hypothetical protein